MSIVFAGALVWISALAQDVGNLLSHSVKWAAGDRSQAVPDNGFSGRASRALRNNLESAAMCWGGRPPTASLCQNEVGVDLRQGSRP
jgi:uncharacterized MAPEG superfamily protein